MTWTYLIDRLIRVSLICASAVLLGWTLTHFEEMRMTTSTEQQLATTVAELVAWYGEEDNGSYSRRIQTAERQLKKLHPQVLKDCKDAVKAETE